jgi:hypothetical protein
LHRRWAIAIRNIRVALAMAGSLVTTVQCSTPVQDSQPKADRFDAWSNVEVSEGEDPHAYGIEVELWRRNGEFIGFLQEYVGPAADPPAGKLEAIQFNEKTGEISFTAKLSVGVVHSDKTGGWVPSRNLYEFSGVTDAAGTMTGTLRKKEIEENGSVTLSDEVVTFKKAPADDMEPFEKWAESWNTTLKIRGPKW